MKKKWVYRVTVGHPDKGLTVPPFYEVSADTVTLEPGGTLLIKSNNGPRRWTPTMWDVYQIRRLGPPSVGSPNPWEERENSR